MNPLAQYQNTFTVEEVLNAPEVTWPFTSLMCSPIGDGAAAVVICSEEFAKKVGASHAVELAACMLVSGEDPTKEEEESTLTRLAKAAYEKAGIGPEDIDVARFTMPRPLVSCTSQRNWVSALWVKEGPLPKLATPPLGAGCL